MDTNEPTDEEKIEREAMEWARLLYDIYQEKKTREALENGQTSIDE